MEIKCWGTRGSLPSSGIEFTKYGGDTICIEITSKEGDKVIIDAGSGIRKLANKLVKHPQRLIHFLFTHYHLDHIMGMPFFHQIFNSKYTFEIFGPAVQGADTVKKAFQTTISPPHFPLGLENTAIQADLNFNTIGETTFKVGPLLISTIKLNHTNHGGLGYKIQEEDKTFVFLTDNELGILHKNGYEMEKYVEFAQGGDLLLHDAQFTVEEYKSHVGWGHSTPNEVVELALKANVKATGFIHFDIDRTDDEIDEIYIPFDCHPNKTFFPVKQGQKFTL